MAVRRSQFTGNFLGSHHQVLEVLGEGTFSVVMNCYNLFTKRMEAVKVFRHQHDADVAMREVSILQELRRLNPDTSNIIWWNSSFSSEQLTWISFELLDQDLRRYIKRKSQIAKTRALQVAEVRPILHQLTTALYHLKTVGVVHADLKPDNILCVNANQQPLRVKLADFGLAQFSCKIDSSLPAQSLCYRAPEVLVGSVFDEAIDMWSLGATAAELVLGTFLYGVRNEYDALRAIIETQGQPPDDVLDQGKFSHYYFEKRSKSSRRWRIKTPKVFQRQTGHHAETELQVLGCLDDISVTMEETHGPQQGQYLLIDLMTEMLRLNPKERIDPMKALNHGFFHANGQCGSLIPGYHQGNNHNIIYFVPIHFGYVHPGIPACNQVANCMYVPGNYHMVNCGCCQPMICPKASEETENISSKKTKRMYKRILK